jgi:hypothetical protein
MGLSKDAFVRGYPFDGATGLHSGEQLEDLVTRASPAEGSEIVDQDTIETYLDEILSVYRLRVKDGSITEDKLADGAITNAKLAEGFTMVKSVQRGVVQVAGNPSYPSGSVDTTVTITAVNPSKSVLLVNGPKSTESAWSVLTNSTTITFTNYNTNGNKVAWQVIEFI